MSTSVTINLKYILVQCFFVSGCSEECINSALNVVDFENLS